MEYTNAEKYFICFGMRLVLNWEDYIDVKSVPARIRDIVNFDIDVPDEEFREAEWFVIVNGVWIGKDWKQLRTTD